MNVDEMVVDDVGMAGVIGNNGDVVCTQCLSLSSISVAVASQYYILT